ncbi:MAG: hypothetical protein V7L07_23895 [Nostoc sp.]
MQSSTDTNHSTDRIIISQLDTNTYPKGFDAEMARKLALHCTPLLAHDAGIDNLQRVLKL